MSSVEKREPKYFKYVILGGGVAAGIKPGELAVISKENVGPYHRSYIRKEYLLSIEDPPDIRVCPPKWYAEQVPTLFRHPDISSFYESYFASKGVEIMAGTGIDEFLACENGELKAVTLSNGQVYDADVFIFVLPNIPIATLFYGQVEIEKVGIKTDGHMRTSVPDVYVVGDVATFPSNMDNDFRKVEQVDHARKSAEHDMRVIKATERGETFYVLFMCFELNVAYGILLQPQGVAVYNSVILYSLSLVSIVSSECVNIHTTN